MRNVMAIAVIVVLILGGTNFLEAQRKSTAVALGLSIGVPAMAAGLGAVTKSELLLAVGLGVGPSLGHFYAEQPILGAIFASLCTASACAFFLPKWSSDAFAQTGRAYIGIGYCVFTLVDLVLVPFSVHRYNRKLQIQPEIDAIEKRYGVSFVYHF